MYNKTFLIGNLTRDPEMRYTPAGVAVARFAIAVNRPKQKSEARDMENQQDVDFLNIVAFRRLAEICGEYMKKGKPVAIEGRLQIRSYEKNGQKMSYTEVIADNIQMLGRRSDETDSFAGNKATVESIPTTMKTQESVGEDTNVPF